MRNDPRAETGARLRHPTPNCLPERYLSAGAAELLPDRHNSVVRVLVVEDEELLAAAVADGLTAEGFDVDVAHDGPDGLWRAPGGADAAPLPPPLPPPAHGSPACRPLRA